MSVYTGDVYTGALNDTQVHNWYEPTVVDVYIPVQDFSSALRAMMAINDLTDDNLGEQIGVNRMTVLNWRKGHQIPSGKNLTKLCEFLEMDENVVKMLIEREKEEEK